MNNAQLAACRNIADQMETSPAGTMIYSKRYGSAVKGYIVETRTAQEMAQAPHNLFLGALLAKEPCGKKWGWAKELDRWVRLA